MPQGRPIMELGELLFHNVTYVVTYGEKLALLQLESLERTYARYNENVISAF